MKQREPKLKSASDQPTAQRLKALVAPGEAELLQTIDTESVAEILALTSLDPALKTAVDNADAVAIYEWVLNNIEYQPYYGSAKGAARFRGFM